MIIDSGVITGSLVVSGSFSQTGSAVIDGNLTVLGLINATISGSVTSASYAATASVAPAYLPLAGGTISGNLIVNGTGSFNVLVTNYESSSVIYSSGSTKFGDSFDDTHQFTGSVTISGGPLQVDGSTVILTNQTSSMSVQTAATSSYPFKLQPLSSNQVLYTNYDGMTVGDGMDSSTFLGADAGNGAFYAAFSTFVGKSSGLTAASASYSTFLGFQAGQGATEASESLFLGYQAGLNTVNAAGSTFIGYQAGLGAGNSTYSNLLGYKAGTSNIGTNNIIIGTNVSLPAGRRDSINLGGVIFATGSYFNTTNPAYTGSATGAKVGILVVNPTLATLEIGGNVYAQSFTGSFSGSITAAISSSYALSASYALNATTAEQAPFYVLTSSFDNFSGSVSTRVTNVESTASVLTSASASLVVASGSTSTRLTDLESTASVLTTASASFAVVSASYSSMSGSASTRLTDLESTASILTTASASFAEVSASYSSMSGSASTRLTNLESFSSSLDATFATDAQVSASINALSSSLAIPIANLEATASTLTSASASFASSINSLQGVTGSYATTGSNTFNGNQTITGSLNVSNGISGNLNGQVTGSFSGSLYNLQNITVNHIPYFSQSQILTDSAMFQVDNGLDQGFSIAINQNGVNVDNPEALFVYQASTSSINVISGKGNLNNYLQLNIQNTNNGANASSDVVATANNGTETTNFIDMGINGANFSGPIGGANDAYLYSTGVHLHIGNATAGQYVGFFAGGDDVDANMKLLLDAGNLHELTGSLNASEGFTGSLQGNAATATSASYAATASFGANFTASNALINNTLTAQTLVVQTITSSVQYSSGSNIFGNLLTNTQQFTGSVTITGSLAVNASNVILTNQTSSMSVLSSSYAVSASQAQNAQTASYVTLAQTASYAALAQTASYAELAQTASHVNPLIQNVFITGALNVTGSSNQIGDNVLLGNNTITGSNALLGDNTVRGNNTISGSLLVSGSETFIGTLSLTGSFLVSGSTNQIGNNFLTGNTQLTGSIDVSGSQTFVGTNTITGSVNISGSTTQVGNNTLLGNTLLSGSIVISGSVAPGQLSASVNIYGDTAMAGFLRFNPYSTNIDTSISASYIYVSGSTQDLYFAQNSKGYTNTTRLRWLEGNLYTGLLNGGLITTQSSTVYQVSSGSGIIVNLNASLNDNPYPTVQYVNWSNLSASIAPLTASYQQAFVAVQSNGTIFQQGTPLANGQFDTLINIGTVLFQNGSTINGVKTQPSVAYGFEQRQSIFTRAFGPLKLSGFTLAPSGSSTGSLIVGSGTAYADGANYALDPNDPSYVIDSGTNVSKIFRYYDSGSTFVYDTNAGAGYGAIDPTKYSNNGTLTTVLPGDWSIQRVFWFPNSVAKAIVVYYGNASYDTEAEAIANINIENFIEAPNTAANAVYLGAIVISGTGVFTTPADYKIVPGGLFRAVGGSGGGGSVVTQTLTGLSDVAITGPTNLQPFAYSSTAAKWINTSILSASIVGNASSATSASYAATSSWAINAINATTASYVEVAQTASYVLNAVSASYSNTASYVANAQTASYVLNAVSASYSSTASYVENAQTASYVTSAQTASYVNPLNQSVQITGSVYISDSAAAFQIVGNGFGQASLISPNGALVLTPGLYGVQINGANPDLTVNGNITSTGTNSSLTGSLFGTASLAQTASYVANAQTASYVLNAVSASYALTASAANIFTANEITASNITVTGTVTAQTLNVQQVTSSIIYSSGSNQFGNLLTDIQQFTGSVTITGSLQVDGRTPLYIDQTSSLSVTSASYAATASSATSTATVPFNVGPTSTYYGTVASTIVGSNNVFTLDTGSYTAAKFIYTVAKGSSSRMGEVLAVWNPTAGQSSFTDVATVDINNTNDVTVSVLIVGSQLELNFESTSTQWTIKSQGTLI